MSENKETRPDGLKAANYAIDALYSMQEYEIGKCFGTVYKTPESVMERLTMADIIMLIDKYYNDTKDVVTSTTRNQTTLTKDIEMDNHIEEEKEIHSIDWYLRNAPHYDEKEVERLSKKKEIKGIIVWYDKYKSTGLIMVKEKNTLRKIFINRNEELNKPKNKIYAGDIVTFHIEKIGYDFFATNVTIQGHLSTGKKGIDLSNDKWIDNQKVARYGIKNAMNSIARQNNMPYEDFIKKVRENGYRYEDFDYVFLTTPNGEYKIFKKGTPVKGDGQVDSLEEFLLNLDQTILGINYDAENFVTYEEYKEKQDQKDDLENKNRKILEYLSFIKAEIVNIGFTNDEARNIIHKNNIEKKIKKMDLEMINPKEIAIQYTKNQTPHQIVGKEYIVFRIKVFGALRGKGYSEKKIKEMFKNYDLNGKIKEIAKENPYEIAQEIIKTI